MKVKDSIPVDSDTYERLFALPCVTAVSRAPSGDITVSLSPLHTEGALRAHTGDRLVQFASGKWQRFGKEAWFRLNQSPKH